MSEAFLDRGTSIPEKPACLPNGFAVEPQKPSGNLSVHIIACGSGKGNARHNGLLSVSNRELASAICAVDLDALERLAEYPRPLDIEVSVSKFGNMICGAAGTMLPSESSGIAVTEEDRISSHANDCGPIGRLDHPRAVGVPGHFEPSDESFGAVGR